MYIFIRQPEENLDIHPYQLYEVYAKNGILNISYGETFSRIFYLIKGYKTTNRIQILSNTLFVPVNQKSTAVIPTVSSADKFTRWMFDL